MDQAELQRMRMSMIESDNDEPSVDSSDSMEGAEVAGRWRRFNTAYRGGDQSESFFLIHRNMKLPQSL